MLSRWYRYRSALTDFQTAEALIREAEADLEIMPGEVSADQIIYYNERLGMYINQLEAALSALKPHLDYVEDLALQVRNLTEKIEKAMEKVAAHSDSAGLLSSAYEDLTTLKTHRAMLIERINDYKQECPGLYEKEDAECRL